MPTTDPLAHEPFRYQTTKSGLVQIHFENRIVTTLKGKAAGRFLTGVESANTADQQQLMARATGQFKFGNER
jgi:hypothetical protein